MKLSHHNCKKQSQVSRRQFNTALASGTLGLLLKPSIMLGAPESIVVASQGGSEMEFHKTVNIPRFESQTGVKVKYLIGNHSDRFVKLRSEVPNPTFNVYFSKYDFVFQAIQLDLLEPVSADVIPGYDRIADRFKNEYSAGVVYTAEGILYNPKIMDKPDSWGVLWDPKYKGKVGLSRFVDRNLMIASLYATGGERIDAEDEGWEALEELIKKQEAKILPGSEQLGQMFEQGEVVLTNFWQARATTYKRAGSPVDFSAPKEGAITEHWAYGIPKGTKDELKTLAGQYIGIAISDESAIAYAESAGYPSAKPDVSYPPEFRDTLLTPEEFSQLKSPDYAWISAKRDEWTNRWNKLLTS
ncbi:MAG: ABC transporter substrate-binding protein [marine bacterium B5-7]|nr:MAG: ABC transporter substrate-binding protein [marine bacterium B5-7]